MTKSKRQLLAFLVGLGIWLLLIAIEFYTGHSNDGSAGFGVGFGICWFMAVEWDRA